MSDLKEKTLFPRKDTIEEAEQHFRAQLPITDQNQLTAALAQYHNTLIYRMSPHSGAAQTIGDRDSSRNTPRMD